MAALTLVSAISFPRPCGDRPALYGKLGQKG